MECRLQARGAGTAPASRDTARSKGVRNGWEGRVWGGVHVCWGRGREWRGKRGETYTFSLIYTSLCFVSYKWNYFCNFKIKF